MAEKSNVKTHAEWRKRVGRIFSFKLLFVVACALAMRDGEGRMAAFVACTTIVAGKRATSSGRVLVGHNEDAKGVFEVRYWNVPARDHMPGALMPCEPGFAAIPQVGHTHAMYWLECKDHQKGGHSFCDTFINEKGVLVVSNSAGETRPETDYPCVDGGIGYNLRRCVGERSGSAREAMELVVKLVSTWGYASPGRMYTVADRDEAWNIQVVSGCGRFVARRIADDEVMLVPNCYTIRTLREGDVRSRELEGMPADYDFAKSCQDPVRWKTTRDLIRWRNLVKRFTGKDWEGDDYPFSVKPQRPVDAAQFQAALSTHYEGTPDEIPVGSEGRRHAEIDGHIPICRDSTVASAVYSFADSPLDLKAFRVTGAPCQHPWEELYPLRELAAAAQCPERLCKSVEALETHLLPTK